MDLLIPEMIIDEWLREDVGLFDLTTQALGIGDKEGMAEIMLREKGVLCGAREAARIYLKAGADEVEVAEEGVEEEGVVLRAVGRAEALHKAWRVAQNVVALASGVATYTRKMVEAAKSINPNVKVIVARKAPPCRHLYYKGVICGGASLHRTSLSDTVILFDNHTVFISFEEALRRLKNSDLVWDKKIVIEVDSVEKAVIAVKEGFEWIQADHLKPDELRTLYERVKSINDRAKVIAAGGIKLENVKEYAFVDAILTSAPYWSKPLDATTKMAPL
ncbi:modD protein [Ignicoccus pacificus DSM 13166]|uniref:Nicotinate-nucleotide pyrophosphorylase [carboxylating] n=1 Tax=Ignicoccus pacificus DSM 13166 TaxID=940294 RepID=A0A977PJI0_9CREN|nr:modD protein [Ignicoccus pacificus DSM 13166]